MIAKKVVWIIIFVSFTLSVFGVASINLGTGTGGGGSLQCTDCNTHFWRLDGTNAPPAANWNMGGYGFANLSDTYMTGGLSLFSQNNSFIKFGNFDYCGANMYWNDSYPELALELVDPSPSRLHIIANNLTNLFEGDYNFTGHIILNDKIERYGIWNETWYNSTGHVVWEKGFNGTMFYEYAYI